MKKSNGSSLPNEPHQPNRPDRSSEIWQLIDDVVNETAGDVQQARLAGLLAADAGTRRLYLDYCELHAGLIFNIRSSQATEDAFANLDRIVGNQVVESGTARDSHSTVASQNASGTILPLTARETPRNWFRLVSGPVLRAAIVTAILTSATLLGVLHSLGWLGQPVARNAELVKEAAPTNSTHAQRKDAAATLTGVVDCRWRDSETAPQYGEPLCAGRVLSLDSGLAQLTWESGAKMIIQGPAEFSVVSELEGRLENGRVTATIPRSAHGFTLQSPQATIVDLGTAFGLDVGPGGRTEVHVFSGEVVAWKSGVAIDATTKNLHIRENQSATFGPESGEPEIGPANSDKFVRKIEPRLDDIQLPPLPIKNDLALWLAADTLVETDQKKGVVAWQDILAGDNQSEESAWQYEGLSRPLLVDDAIGGRPALRFNGRSSFMTTTTLTTTDDQTVFIVFSPGKGSARRPHGGQLLNYNGPPHRFLLEPGSAGVFQIGDLASTDSDHQRVGFLRGHVFSGWKNKMPIDVASIFSEKPLVEGEAVLGMFQYSHSAGFSELKINGISQGTATAPTSIAATSRKVIGRHGAQSFFFLGDIAEIVIYNAALSADKISQSNQYFSQRYSLELQGDTGNGF